MQVASSICSLICIQAHRLGTENLELHQKMMRKFVQREIRTAIWDDLHVFRVGLNMGADIWGAEEIIELRNAYFPHIQLHCYLPAETQANNWPEDWREPYFDVLAQADDVICLQRHYSRGCVQKRNQELLAGAARLIALHDNIAQGGIDKTIDYAEAMGIETVVVRPREGPDAPAARGRILHLGTTQSNSQVSSTYSVRFSTGKSAIKRAW